jgi:tetraacyldisaccharide 4'-kinase
MAETSASNDFGFIENRKVYGFSGIAGNHYFRRTIEELSCAILKSLDFPDHYKYSASDAERIGSEAKRLKADYIITTEKDYARIYKYLPWPVDLVVVGVKIEFEDEEKFQAFIKKSLMNINKTQTKPLDSKKSSEKYRG